jgi:hypothetical protein
LSENSLTKLIIVALCTVNTTDSILYAFKKNTLICSILHGTRTFCDGRSSECYGKNISRDNKTEDTFFRSVRKPWSPVKQFLTPRDARLLEKRKEFAEVGTRAYTRGTLSKSEVGKKRVKDFEIVELWRLAYIICALLTCITCKRLRLYTRSFHGRNVMNAWPNANLLNYH